MGKLTPLWQRLPILGALLRHRDALLAENRRLRAQTDRLWQEPGHFYSPIPNLEDVRSREAAIFDRRKRPLPGIDLNEDRQWDLLQQLRPFYDEQPFAAQPQAGVRYGFDNPHYAHTDALLLYSMIRRLQPQRIIEVGSGYSSCVMLDTNERFCDGRIHITHIEPYPALLKSLLPPAEANALNLIAADLQTTPLDHFRALQANDILFIDSTHVSKTGSDVNYLFFEILPALKPGVFIHIHDIFYPFEYPTEWVYAGRAWNEAYLLHAFLQYNRAFSIQLMSDYLVQQHRDWFANQMPLCLQDPGGSIWLRKEANA